MNTAVAINRNEPFTREQIELIKVANSGRGRTTKILIPGEMLRWMYVDKKLSTLEIATAFGCGKRAILVRLRKLEIPRRGLVAAFAVSRTHYGNNPKHGADCSWWRGGTKLHTGYRMLLRPDHPEANADGYVFEHRVVAERIIGRRLAHREEVHHVNGDRLDNRPENLRVMTKSNHMSLHMKERHAAGKIPYRRKA